MNVVVCVKQIPDPAAPQSLDASHNLDRSGKLILDEADTYGVEMALQLVDKAGSGEVTVVSMGSAADVAGLRNALAMGAAKAVIVSDDALRGTDALGTAKVLAAVIKRESPDLILAATESSDGYTGTTPVQLAELLGLAVDHLRQVGRRRWRHGEGGASDRVGLRRGEFAHAVRGDRDRRGRRTSLRLLQGHHGRQVQARRDPLGRRPRARRCRGTQRCSPGDHRRGRGRVTPSR